MSKRNRAHSTILDSNSEELRRSCAAANERSDGASETVFSGKRDTEKNHSGGYSKKESSKNSRTLYILFVVGISVALAILIMFKGVLNINEGLTSELTVYETSLSGVADGAYTGAYSTAHMSAEVSVAVVSERISAIQLDRYAGIEPERAKMVIETIIRYQALNAPDDSIGSEYTDKIIQRAVMDALYNAVKESAENQPESVSNGDASTPVDSGTAPPVSVS